ncbi:hypothetical protein [Actinoplanes sp. ATCC 53533]|uniref:hypothetical protein n=1 Tax=Actinoplanes sp. ATCC 53533 TaxID=1288362 RepID=UPI0018F6364B|nr:hypothetical protein [Actinoplanes sp. ATCC 53533]
MTPTTLTAAARWFPLLGRPRPNCPALPLRVQEVVDAVHAARQKPGNGMADAARALNMAALIAGDAGMTDLARQLCWQHIDTYCRAGRRLTMLEARYLLEPVVHLARLQIRAGQYSAAYSLLVSMFENLTRGWDLIVDGQTLPLARLVGDHEDSCQLWQWVQRRLICEGVRALGLAGQWQDAADHARRFNGIGDHLMEGRQAQIIARCQDGDRAQARVLLAESVITEPWEQDVAACLQVMCSDPGDEQMVPTATVHAVAAAVARYTGRPRTSGYASYHARLGLTVAILAHPVSCGLATELLDRVATDAISSADGYAARDVLGFRDPILGITHEHRLTLDRLATEAGIGVGTLPEPNLQQLTAAADKATAVLDNALASASLPDTGATTRGGHLGPDATADNGRHTPADLQGLLDAYHRGVARGWAALRPAQPPASAPPESAGRQPQRPDSTTRPGRP